jgi:hypothetical protein
LNKSSCLPPALVVTKFTNAKHIIWSYFVMVLKLGFIFNKPTSKAGLLNKSLSLAVALSVTKFTIARDMILVTLCCAT